MLGRRHQKGSGGDAHRGRRGVDGLMTGYAQEACFTLGCPVRCVEAESGQESIKTQIDDNVAKTRGCRYKADGDVSEGCCVRKMAGRRRQLSQNRTRDSCCRLTLFAARVCLIANSIAVPEIRVNSD